MKRRWIIYIVLFLLAFVVRLIVWQNNKAAIDSVQYVITQVYKQDARLLLTGDVAGFLMGPDPPSDAMIIMHPPGYPIFIAAVYRIFGENESLRIIQIVCASLAPILIFLIAALHFDERTAIIAGTLTALAPQFSYYSAIILPDEPSALPILAAVYLLLRASIDHKLMFVILCGAGLGMSCWLRSNALLLPAICIPVIMFTFTKGWRFKSTVTVLAAFILTIAPITIRNYVVFKSFIPISTGFGTTFIEGLGEIDREGKFGLPSTDEGVMEMDARIARRSDYYGNLYNPDGIQREQERIRIGLNTVGRDPIWYFTSVARRGLMVFRMERVPVIASKKDDETKAFFYYLNIPLKLFQKLFITPVFLPLILFGIVLLIVKNKHRSALIILSSVPVYYMTIQALIHTEYRYLLPATHVLMIFASFSCSWLIDKLIPLRSSNPHHISVSQ